MEAIGAREVLQEVPFETPRLEIRTVIHQRAFEGQHPDLAAGAGLLGPGGLVPTNAVAAVGGKNEERKEAESETA